MVAKRSALHPLLEKECWACCDPKAVCEALGLLGTAPGVVALGAVASSSSIKLSFSSLLSPRFSSLLFSFGDMVSDLQRSLVAIQSNYQLTFNLLLHQISLTNSILLSLASSTSPSHSLLPSLSQPQFQPLYHLSPTLSSPLLSPYPFPSSSSSSSSWPSIVGGQGNASSNGSGNGSCICGIPVAHTHDSGAVWFAPRESNSSSPSLSSSLSSSSSSNPLLLLHVPLLKLNVLLHLLVHLTLLPPRLHLL